MFPVPVPVPVPVPIPVPIPDSGFLLFQTPMFSQVREIVGGRSMSSVHGRETHA